MKDESNTHQLSIDYEDGSEPEADLLDNTFKPDWAFYTS